MAAPEVMSATSSAAGQGEALAGELAAGDLEFGEQARRAGGQPVGAERDRHAGADGLGGEGRCAVEAQVGLRRPDQAAAGVGEGVELVGGQGAGVDDVGRRGGGVEFEEAWELGGAALVAAVCLRTGAGRRR